MTMSDLILKLYVVVSYALWIPAIYFVDHISKGKSKLKRALAIIALIACFVVWIEGINKSYAGSYDSGYTAGYEDGLESRR